MDLSTDVPHVYLDQDGKKQIHKAYQRESQCIRHATEIVRDFFNAHGNIIINNQF